MQAVDFNILIISIVVLYSVLNSRIVAQSSTRATVAICVSAWIPGLITSNVGLAVGSYGHVSGNWCWIRPDFLGMRYALTHGWRIAIFVATVVIYTFIYVYLKRVFGKFRMSNPSSGTGNTASRDQLCVDDGVDDDANTQHILISSSFAVSHELDERAAAHAPRAGRRQGHLLVRLGRRRRRSGAERPVADGHQARALPDAASRRAPCRVQDLGAAQPQEDAADERVPHRLHYPVAAGHHQPADQVAGLVAAVAERTAVHDAVHWLQRLHLQLQRAPAAVLETVDETTRVPADRRLL